MLAGQEGQSRDGILVDPDQAGGLADAAPLGRVLQDCRLDTAGENRKSLIVVGNRGLGAAEGEMLGSVPAAVVRGAHCDVLIVQGIQGPGRMSSG